MEGCPLGWTEAVHENRIEWGYEEHSTVSVRLTPTEDQPGDTVWARAGVTSDGDRMQCRPVWGLEEAEAFAVVFTLFSATNGATRRMDADPESNGDR